MTANCDNPCSHSRHFRVAPPSLFVAGAAKAIDFYKKALGAEEVMRFPTPDGKIMHAEIRIGDSRIMLGDEMPEQGGKGPKSIGGTPVSFFVYQEDVDTAWKALRLFETGTADFADYVIERSANAAGCKLTVTFDKKASSTGMELLK